MASLRTKLTYLKREILWVYRDLYDFFKYKLFGPRGRILSILVPPHQITNRSECSYELVDLLCDASKHAFSLTITVVDKPDSQYANIFPGEHYKLLAAITSLLQPSVIIEIGTSTGLASTVFRQYSDPHCKIHTFDIVPWTDFDTHISPEYFSGGSFVQHLSDLSQDSDFQRHSETLAQAGIIFLDGPKNLVFETTFLKNISQLLTPCSHTRLLIIDDIHFANMVDLWSSIISPKIDATAFGHFSGTGIVDITNGLQLNT